MEISPSIGRVYTGFKQLHSMTSGCRVLRWTKKRLSLVRLNQVEFPFL